MNCPFLFQKNTELTRKMESDLVADLDPNATLEGMDLELDISIGEIIDEIVNTSISQERDETADQIIERLLTQVNCYNSSQKLATP